MRPAETSSGSDPRAGVARLDPDAFASLFEESRGTLWCIAAAVLGRRAGVEDVLQEAAVIGLKKLDDFVPGTEFSAWMGQIVRFVAQNHGRRAARRRASSIEVAASVTAAPDATEPGAVSASGSLVRGQSSFDDDLVRALGALDETARACLLMRTVLDRSYKEIAAALDVPEGTAMSHVHRARKRLREVLSNHDAGSSSDER